MDATSRQAPTDGATARSSGCRMEQHRQETLQQLIAQQKNLVALTDLVKLINDANCGRWPLPNSSPRFACRREQARGRHRQPCRHPLPNASPRTPVPCRLASAVDPEVALVPGRGDTNTSSRAARPAWASSRASDTKAATNCRTRMYRPCPGYSLRANAAASPAYHPAGVSRRNSPEPNIPGPLGKPLAQTEQLAGCGAHPPALHPAAA